MNTSTRTHRAHSSFLTVLVLSLWPSLNLAQVAIRERVAIVPSQASSLPSPGAASSHQIRIVCSLQGAKSWHLVLHGPCVDSLVLPSVGPDGYCPEISSVEYVCDPFPAGGWNADPKLYLSYGGEVSFDTKFFVDGTLFDERATTINASDYEFSTFYGLSRNVPSGYCGGMGFGLVNNLPGFNHLERRQLGVALSDGCAGTPGWFATFDPATVSIVSGAEYGSFHLYESGAPVGQSFAALAADMSKYMYVADGTNPPEEGAMVTVQASAPGGIVSRDSFMVGHMGPVTLTWESDNFAVNDLERLYVTCRTRTNDGLPWVSTPYGITFRLSLAEDSLWAQFLDDATGKLDSVMDGVLSDWSGRITCSILALGRITTTPHDLRIRFTASIPEIAPAETTITVLPGNYPRIAVQFNPPSLRPGDTATVLLKKMTAEGVLHDFPPAETFYVSIDAGSRFGFLLSGTSADTGQYLWDATQPFKVVAQTQTTEDSLGLLVSVEHTPGPGGKALAGKARLLPHLNAHLEGTESPREQNTDPDECSGWGWEPVRRTEPSRNRPPEITAIRILPSRKYFALDSTITIYAEATDPDGDQVTVTYRPSQSVQLKSPGPFVFTVEATDNKGGRSERKDTVVAVFVAVSPGLDRVVDGNNIDYTVKIVPPIADPASFCWSWAPTALGAGNSPRLELVPDSLQQTVTIRRAKWYASPDDACRANSESRYSLACEIVIAGDPFERKGELTVYLPHSAGEVSPPAITGQPFAVGRVDAKGICTEYRVSSIGTLNRRLDPPKFFVPVSSQFYPKAYAHEMKHIAQWNTGMLSDLFLVHEFFQRIKGKRAGTLSDLADVVAREKANFITSQIAEFKRRRDDSEIEAYAISDPIPPQYLYQRCGRTKF